jgi:hypothetical protein
MEKRPPHCKMPVVKALVEAGKVRTTHAARTGANELGFSFSDMLDVVMALTPAGHPKLLHLWPVKLPQAGRSDYAYSAAVAMREAASFRR